MQTWIETFNEGRLRVDLEITSQCNSYCPQCMRYKRANADGTVGSEELADYTPNEKWDLQQFKTFLDSETLLGLSSINISGTLGDPATCNDLPEMVEYARSVNKHMTVNISTNGSLQNEEWWWRLGTAGGNMMTITFAVEGIDQETHSKYRRNTNLEKILQNMETVSYTKANVGIFTVIFKHNQDQVDEIYEMAKGYGATFHDKIHSTRFFDQDNKFHFVDRKGNADFLEKADVQVENLFRMPDRRYDEATDVTEAHCKWNEWGKILILEDGTVYPCCYVAFPIQTKKSLYTGRFSFLNDPDNISLKNKTLKEILESDFYTAELFESLKTPEMVCRQFCGVKK